MGMNISNHNLSAVIANNRLKKQEDLLSQSMERLSTGISLNHAKDHPAHMALSQKLSTHINGMEEARKNADNTSSLLRTADSVLEKMTEMIKRMRELSVEAANGTNLDSDREELHKEFVELRDEIDRMSRDTEYNTKALFDGSLARRAYSSKTKQGTSGVYEQDLSRVDVSSEVKAGEYKMKVTKAQGNENAKVELVEAVNGKIGFPATARVYAVGNHVTVSGPGGFEMNFKISENLDDDTEVSLNVTDIGNFQVQFGENEGGTLEVSIPAVNSETLYMDDLDISTEDGASKAIFQLDESMRFLTQVRSRLGAYDNRMETVSESLRQKNENLTSAASKVRDTDMAAEMTEYTSGNILIQASTSVLSQCNDQPEMVLQILQ